VHDYAAIASLPVCWKQIKEAREAPPSKLDHSAVAYALNLLYLGTSVCHRTDEAAIIA
jgi:hypothetical protein